MKKKSIKKWEFSRKKGEEISIPKFGGGGKNKQFWTEYSPLHPRYPLAHEEDEARCFHQNPNLHENISCNFNQINVKSLIQLFLNNNHQPSFKIPIIPNCKFANSTEVHIILQSNRMHNPRFIESLCIYPNIISL